MRRTCRRWSVVVVVVLASMQAQAAETPPPGSTGAPTPVVSRSAPPVAPAGKRLHRGFFLRLALGAVYLNETSSLGGGSPGASYRGLGSSLETSVGHSVLRPGLIVGGKWLFAAIVDPSESYLGATYTMSTSARFLDVLAAFVDDYPNPRRGFHFGGSAGLLAETYLDAAYGAHTTGWGGALSAHVGWESFFSNRWSCGILGQLTAYHYGDREAGVSETYNGVLPTVAVAFTFN